MGIINFNLIQRKLFVSPKFSITLFNKSVRRWDMVSRQSKSNFFVSPKKGKEGGMFTTTALFVALVVTIVFFLDCFPDPPWWSGKEEEGKK
jgi:hypothetical protein